MSHIKRVFKISDSKTDIICPPDQVFVDPSFVFSITIGHHLADDEREYAKLMHLLKELGETEFYLIENLGATPTKNVVPFQVTIPTASNLEYFDEIVKSYDPPFGFSANHFYVFGKNPGWGIYIAEFPTINIIGCIPDLKEKFRKVFNINGTGYSALAPFISQEFTHRDDLKSKLIENYRLVEISK